MTSEKDPSELPQDTVPAATPVDASASAGEKAAESVSPNLIALVGGKEVTELPTDLYIPPEALEVVLEAFEGPLDLLLYLIRRQNLDILEIRVSEITAQYMHYIDLMQALQLELAAEYLLMAALLAEIKSRMLLPKPSYEEEDDEDPRSQLIRRLQEYEQFKTAAQDIEALPRLERDIFLSQVEPPETEQSRPVAEVELKDLLLALSDVLHRADMYQHHAVHMEPLSVRERMSSVLAKVSTRDEFVPFADLFDVSEGRHGVVVTFLSLLELMKEFLIQLVQSEAYAPIYVGRADDSRREEAKDLAHERTDSGSR